MLVFPQFDPVAISIGPIKIHWYGVMYLIAFGGAWILANSRKDKFNYEWSKDQISDLVFYGSMGAVLGGRLGSVFFYNFDRFLETLFGYFVFGKVECLSMADSWAL